MRRSKKFLAIFYLAMSAGCGGITAASAGSIKMNASERISSLAALDSGAGADKLNNEDFTHVSAFGYNERAWQAADLQDLRFPLWWLEDPEKLSEQIYVVKQAGRAAIFCLIDSRNGEKDVRERSAKYLIVLMRVRGELGERTWEDYFKKEFVSSYRDHRLVNIGEIAVAQMNWNSDQYWSAPSIFFQRGREVVQLTMIYRGYSRGYANQIMNKFPWRAVAQN